MAGDKFTTFVYTLVTGGGLFVFLVVSFLMYHRRVTVRRRLDVEYREYFRFMRPDLVDDSKTGLVTR